VVEVLGNSLIAGDGVVDVLRARLVARFGDAGRGLVLADRMASYGGRSRSAAAASGWKASTIAPPFKHPWPFGLTGVHHTSEDSGATSTFELRGETSAEVFWLDRPEATPVVVSVDGAPMAVLEPQRERAGRRTRVALPAGARTLTLEAKGAGAVIHGVTLEKEQPGVMLDMLGVPSADAALFLTTDAAIFADHLAARRPKLVVLMLGGNEVKRINWGRSTAESVENDLRALLGRIKGAATTACWVIGPPDAVVRRPGSAFTPREHLEEVIAIERKVALEQGCAFFDLFQAMGGSGSIKRFHQRQLMHKDRIHPKGRGLDVLGQLIADALSQAWQQTPPTSPVAAGGGAR
jgi:lysophospholipase L1-like esterase